ncbi:hypothetical protein BJV77DRAFT_968091 [Russula vinacea]|nr:hypothetical protein BJV77DRAFT_968091 [Russula vinacea]
MISERKISFEVLGGSWTKGDECEYLIVMVTDDMTEDKNTVVPTWCLRLAHAESGPHSITCTNPPTSIDGPSGSKSTHHFDASNMVLLSWERRIIRRHIPCATSPVIAEARPPILRERPIIQIHPTPQMIGILSTRLPWILLSRGKLNIPIHPTSFKSAPPTNLM